MARRLPALPALAGAMVTGLLTLSGLGLARAGAPGRPTAAITITDTSLSMPARIQAGYALFTITNAGTMPHDASFVRFNPGATLDQVIAAAQLGETPEGFQTLLQLVSFSGGTAVDPGTTTAVALNLTPGTYAVGDPPQLSAGVVQTFTVTAPPSDVAAPRADVAVTLREFAFDAPATVSAGQTTFQIRNAGQQSHELVLFRIDAGHTLQELLALPQDAPPPDWVHTVPSWDPAAPGVDGEYTVTLVAGTYGMVCFLPDPRTGQPHALLGMTRTVTAQ